MEAFNLAMPNGGSSLKLIICSGANKRHGCLLQFYRTAALHFNVCGKLI